jgi:hypothetical protein
MDLGVAAVGFPGLTIERSLAFGAGFFVDLAATALAGFA